MLLFFGLADHPADLIDVTAAHRDHQITWTVVAQDVLFDGLKVRKQNAVFQQSQQVFRIDVIGIHFSGSHDRGQHDFISHG